MSEHTAAAIAAGERRARARYVGTMTAEQVEEFCRRAVNADEIDWSFR
jgi:hypothetical protein